MRQNEIMGLSITAIRQLSLAPANSNPLYFILPHPL
jgi:hypothetical protein